MLSPDEIREIDEALARVPRPDGASIEVLQIVQRHRGWISDEALRDLAAHTGLSVHALDNVATFYNLIYRRPIGRHVIHQCDSVSCWILGSERLHRALCERLGVGGFGETSADGRFTLLPIQCLGTCDRAPAVMVDEDLHRDLAPEAVDGVLEGYE